MDSIAASARTSRARVCSCFVLSCLLAITLQVVVFSPISPDTLELPPTSSASLVPTNSRLQRVIKLGEGFLENPEDVCVDKNGILYTATRDGWIKRLGRNGSWENWRKIDSNALLGITTTNAGSLIACDGEKGLLKVDEDGVTVLTSHVKGTEIRFNQDCCGKNLGEQPTVRIAPRPRHWTSAKLGRPAQQRIKSNRSGRGRSKPLRRMNQTKAIRRKLQAILEITIINVYVVPVLSVPFWLWGSGLYIDGVLSRVSLSGRVPRKDKHGRRYPNLIWRFNQETANW